MSDRVSKEDLDVAILWLESYEAPDGDDTGERCQRVADFLRTEQKNREREAAVRSLMKQTGKSAKEIRAAMKAKGL